MKKAKQINLNSALILKKNKDYQSIPEAQQFYEKQRLTKLAETLYPETEIPDGFNENLKYLMVFQNPVQMNVWHDSKKSMINQETGETVSTTWHNFCYLNRQIICAEMYQAIEILKRATPNELYNEDRAKQYFNNVGDKWGREVKQTDAIIIFFNEVAYPEIEKCVSHIQLVLDEIEEQLCKPIRDKINADLKVMMQLPVGQNVEFIKGKQRKM